MEHSKKFDPRNIDRLNNPERFNRENPDVIWKELNLADPRVLVDIGAGTGFFAVPFARKSPQITVYACELQQEMLAWLKDHVPAELRDRLIPLKMEERSVPLADGIADLVYMINLHHELDDRQAIMSEARRLLRSGGTVLVIDWKKAETPSGPPLALRVGETEIGADLVKAGFREVTNHPVLPYHSFVTARKA